MRLRLVIYVAFIFAAAVMLQACTSRPLGEDILEGKLEPKTTGSTSSAKRAQLDRFIASNGDTEEPAFRGILKTGNDRLTGPPLLQLPEAEANEAEDITLNLVNVPVANAAKSVLAEILELNYSVDGRVAGNVTLQTSTPISRRKLLALFESVLRDNGAAIVADGETYRIVPLSDAARTLTPVETTLGEADRPGTRPYAVSLRFVSVESMAAVLEPMIPQGMLIKTDARSNTLIFSGTAREVAAIKETISVFDVDWMRGMSIALIPVKSSSPEAIVRDLESIYETRSGPLKGVLRFAPNKRLKSVLVITSRAKYLREAAEWIRKIDVLAESSEESLHVYNVQNRTASELAEVLQSVLKPGEKATEVAESQVAPKLVPVVTGTQDGGLPAQQQQEQAPTGDIANDGGTPEVSGDQPIIRARVVADDANNSLLIFATGPEYERILGVLEEIDSIPNQVLLEAVIAEVSLDDDLRFGVRWFFGEEGHGTKFTDSGSGAASSIFPGFSYFLKANDISFSLNALSSVTNVQVLSSPSLVVLDNKTATLQVGDQVPIVTQSATGTETKDTVIVNKVELKDTGVILNVTPRVNDSGRVILEIEQEVSTVVKTTTSGIDSPTIRQRKVKTSVVVNDGEALALGGLIQERESTGKSKVPILGDVPLLGNAFRQKSNSISRTELIIFIRPQVIRDLEEARRVTLEFRKQLSIVAPRVRTGEPTPGEELFRIIN